MIAAASYQVAIVPQENAQVEYNHNQEVQADMVDLRGSMLESARSRQTTTTSVRLGTTYPARALFVNPPAPVGRLRTVGTNDGSVNVTIRNASAVTGADIGVKSYWNGSERRFRTGAVVYEPNYNAFQSAPATGVDNAVTFNRQDGRTVPVTGQRLIDGEEINLLTFTGNLSESGAISAAVDVKAVSASDNIVTVNNSSGISITLSTQLSNETWNRLLSGQENVDRVQQVASGETFNRIRIDLAGNVTYRLRLSKVGVGTVQEDNANTPEYVVTTEGDDVRVATGTEQAVGFELRDRLNNPSEGTVNITMTGPGEICGLTCISEGSGPMEVDTGTDGQVDLTYNANGGVGTPTVSATLNGGNTAQANLTVYNATNSVVAPSDDGKPSWFRDYLKWDRTNITAASGVSNTSCPSEVNDANAFCIEYTQSGNLDLSVTSGDLVRVSVSYQANDSAAIDGFDPEWGVTDTSGRNETTAIIGENGWAELTVESVNSNETMYLHRNVSSEPVPDEPGNEYIAFSDANGNGEYDDGETRYTENDLSNFQDGSVDLVIAENIGEGARANTVAINQANSVTVTSGTTVRVQNGFTISSNVGEITVRGTVDSISPIDIRPSGTLDIEGATLRADNDVTLRSESTNGDILATDSTIEAGGNGFLLRTNKGNIVLEDATVRAQNNRQATINGNGELYLSGLRIQDQNQNGAVMDVSVQNGNRINGEGQIAQGSIEQN